MILPAPKWLAWVYAAAFWLFVVAALAGSDNVSAIGYLGMKVLFFVLAVAGCSQLYSTQSFAEKIRQAKNTANRCTLRTPPKARWRGPWLGAETT
jgi:hypothetical protein